MLGTVNLTEKLLNKWYLYVEVCLSSTPMRHCAVYFTSVNLFAVLYHLSFPTPIPAFWIQYSWAADCCLQWPNLDYHPDSPLRWRQKGLVIPYGLWQKVSIPWQITNFLSSYTVASLKLTTHQEKKKNNSQNSKSSLNSKFHSTSSH